MLSALFIYNALSLSGQSDFFYEIELEKSISESEKWDISAASKWKHTFNEYRWSRFGVIPAVTRKLNNWSLSAGSEFHYTFDKEIDNFWEIRPWAALGFKFSLFDNFKISQRLRTEWRNFNGDGSDNRANYHRLRYRVNLHFSIGNSERWSQLVGFETYFLDGPAFFERFSNERDFQVRMIRQMPNGHTLSFGVKAEVFLSSDVSNSGEGYIFLIQYRF